MNKRAQNAVSFADEEGFWEVADLAVSGWIFVFAIWAKVFAVCENVIFTTLTKRRPNTAATPTGVRCEEV